MAAEQSQRSVEFQISNSTKKITLRNPRAFLPSGHCSVPPSPLLPPGSKDSCKFSSSILSTCEGILTYESDMFTLAIFFSNPVDHKVSPVRLGLNIFPVHVGHRMPPKRLSWDICDDDLDHSMSPNRLSQDISDDDRDHSVSPEQLSQEVRQGNLEFVYDNMAQRTFSPGVVTMSARGTQFNCAQMRISPVQVVATMSNACSSVVKVDVTQFYRRM